VVAPINTLRRIVYVKANKMGTQHTLFELNRKFNEEFRNCAHNTLLGKALAAVQSQYFCQ